MVIFSCYHIFNLPSSIIFTFKTSSLIKESIDPPDNVFPTALIRPVLNLCYLCTYWRNRNRIATFLIFLYQRQLIHSSVVFYWFYPSLFLTSYARLQIQCQCIYFSYWATNQQNKYTKEKLQNRENSGSTNWRL